MILGKEKLVCQDCDNDEFHVYIFNRNPRTTTVYCAECGSDGARPVQGDSAVGEEEMGDCDCPPDEEDWTEVDREDTAGLVVVTYRCDTCGEVVRFYDYI